MGARKCVIENCSSCTNRIDDVGVTFHRFPINPTTRKQWIESARLGPTVKLTKGTFVCSRHFRQADFQTFKGTKYLLRHNTVPSIFPWSSEEMEDVCTESDKVVKKECKKSVLEDGAVAGPSEPVKDCKLKFLEAIKQEVKSPAKRSISADEITSEPKKKILRKSSDSAIIKEKTVDKTPQIKLIEPSTLPKRSGQITSFVPGTKIEAQDFNNAWHTVKIVEVDNDDREVLIHFEKNIKGKIQGSSDEWISMDSSRLRPIQQYKRAPISFVVGEKCLARWSDARKFPATVQKVLERDMYEVLFDDGFTKIVKANHMGKVRNQQFPGSPGNTNKPPPTNIPLIPKPEPIDWEKIPEPPEGEWACHWFNDAPVGQESTVRYAEGRMIKTIVVRDDRLPEGWLKHLFQRSGILYKWELLITNLEGQVFRKKNDIKQYFEEKQLDFDAEKFDFSLHKKRAKELGLSKYSPDYFASEHIQLATSKKNAASTPIIEAPIINETLDSSLNVTTVDFVMIGSLKVQIIDNLFRCPEISCEKSFRKENHLQIHVKHYHKDIAENLGVCPNMQDLAYLRTLGTPTDEPLPKNHLPNQQFFEKVHQHDLQNKHQRKSIGLENVLSEIPEENFNRHQTGNDDLETPTRKLTLLENALSSMHTTGIKTEFNSKDVESSSRIKSPTIDMKHETQTETVKVTKQRSTSNKPNFGHYRKKGPKSRTNLAKHHIRVNARRIEEPSLVESFTEYDDTRHSFGSPDTMFKRQNLLNNPFFVESGQDTNSQNNSSIADHSQSPKYINEDGEVIKIVRMRQEEIINCICTFPEEDGLMIQCELCLCWQHGVCNGIERESEVPEKYVCYICRNPHCGRHSMKHKHDQEWLYEGRLPTLKSNGNPTRSHRHHILKQTHKLTGNLLELKQFLHSLKVKINIAERKDHPKMYLWSKKWETSPIRTELAGVEPLIPKKQTPSEKMEVANTDIKLTNPELGEILQEKPEKKIDNSEEQSKEIKTESEVKEEEEEKKEMYDENNELLSGLIETPGGTNIDLIKDNNKTPNIPLPEAAIDPTECQHRLLEHIQKQQTKAMLRLQSIEDQILSLESIDETTDKLDNENYTRTKQTIQMLIKDLTSMRKIAAVNATETYGIYI